MAQCIDNSLIGLFILLSLQCEKPLILIFLDEEMLQKIPEYMKKSPFYLKAWKILTAVWGGTCVFTAVFIMVLEAFRSNP